VALLLVAHAPHTGVDLHRSQAVGDVKVSREAYYCAPVIRQFLRGRLPWIHKQTELSPGVRRHGQAVGGPGKRPLDHGGRQQMVKLLADLEGDHQIRGSARPESIGEEHRRLVSRGGDSAWPYSWIGRSWWANQFRFGMCKG